MNPHETLYREVVRVAEVDDEFALSIERLAKEITRGRLARGDKKRPGRPRKPDQHIIDNQEQPL